MPWTPPTAQLAEPTREPVARYNSLETEVWIPAAQALLISGAWSLVALLLTSGVAWWLRLPWWLVPLCVVGVFVALLAWRVTRYIGERQEAQWKREREAGVDLDGDGVIGKPDDLRLVNVHNARRELLQRQADDFRHFLKLAYDGRGTTLEAWDGAKLPSGREVTRPVWELYCKRLLDSGLAVRAYQTAPLELVGGYRDALAVFGDVWRL